MLPVVKKKVDVFSGRKESVPALVLIRLSVAISSSERVMCYLHHERN